MNIPLISCKSKARAFCGAWLATSGSRSTLFPDLPVSLPCYTGVGAEWVQDADLWLKLRDVDLSKELKSVSTALQTKDWWGKYTKP